MKYILLISTLMFSAGSWAEWTEVSEVTTGNKSYVDFDRIRKVNGLVYYWCLRLLGANNTGTMSYKIYSKADCETMRRDEVELCHITSSQWLRVLPMTHLLPTQSGYTLHLTAF